MIVPLVKFNKAAGEGNVEHYLDSDLKPALEAWYEDNLLNNYNDYIADTIFCNYTQIADVAFTGSGTVGDPYVSITE